MNEAVTFSESRLRVWIIGCVVAANVAAYGYAMAESRMLTFYVATIYGPLLNAALLLISLVVLLVMKTRDRQLSLARTLGVALGAPVLASVLFGTLGLLYVRMPQKPNKSPEPTPTAVTPRATEGKTK